MKLSSSGLRLELLPLGLADEEDWCRVHVVAAVNGFRGDFEAWLQSADLERFRIQVRNLYDAVGKPCTATLSSAEPDIEISLTMGLLGGVQGSYRLESERREGDATALSGSFELDQSFLPSLGDTIESLILELRGGRAA